MRQRLQILHGRQHDDLYNFVQSEGCALTIRVVMETSFPASNVGLIAVRLALCSQS